MSSHFELAATARFAIRVAAREDLDALMALEQGVFQTDQLSRQSMRRLIGSPSADVLVAEQSGTIVGAAVVLFRLQSCLARLYSLAVAPELGRNGIGAALLAAAEERAQTRGRSTMRLEVSIGNAAAIARYTKSGYRQFGRRVGYYQDGSDALQFEKDLVPH